MLNSPHSASNFRVHSCNSWLKKIFADFRSHILFDSSGGRGKFKDPINFLNQVNQIVRYFNLDQEKIILAGGLNAENISSFYRLASEILDQRTISLDAQGRLRGRSYKGRKVGDRLNPQKVFDYIQACSSLYQM